MPNGAQPVSSLLTAAVDAASQWCILPAQYCLASILPCQQIEVKPCFVTSSVSADGGKGASPGVLLQEIAWILLGWWKVSLGHSHIWQR